VIGVGGVEAAVVQIAKALWAGNNIAIDVGSEKLAARRPAGATHAVGASSIDGEGR
jgi:Zn-dependent alcohol dehydrogenase